MIVKMLVSYYIIYTSNQMQLISLFLNFLPVSTRNTIVHN